MSRSRFAILAAAVGLVLATPAPTHAATHVHADVVGMAATGHMGYPGAAPARTNESFSLTSMVCVDNSQHVQKGTPLPMDVGATCSLGASGEIDGHCGSASGEMSGTFTASVFRVYDFEGAFTIVGTSFAFNGSATKQGTNQTGPIAIVGQIVQNPLFSGSCANGTQTAWFFAGTVEIAVVPPL